MVKVGNVLYHNRNWIFPLVYIFLFIPAPEVWSNPKLAQWIGLGVSGLGQGIRMATIGLKYIIRGGKNRRVYAEDLVTSGIFSHVRNPLYVGNLLMIIGLGIMSNSWLFLGIVVPLFLFVYQAIVLAEENFLFSKFGESYLAYKLDVNRWCPNFEGISETLQSMQFNWNRVVLKEYNTTFIMLAGMVLMWLKHSLHHPQYYRTTSSNLWIFAALILTLAIGYTLIRYLKKSGKLQE